MKRLFLAACLLLASLAAKAQYIDFAYPLFGNHLDGLPAVSFVGPYSGTPILGDFIYFDGSNWVSLNKPADGTYAVTFTAGVPSWAIGGGGGYATVQDEGVPLTQRTTINCVGAGITCSDSGGVTVFTVPAAAGAVSLQGSSPGTPDTGNWNVTGVGTSTHDNIHATLTPGLFLSNTQAALVGQQQEYSPSLKFCGAGWNTGGGASETDCWQMFSRPIAGNPTTEEFSVQTSLAGAAYVETAKLNSAGKLTLGVGGATDGQVSLMGATSGSITVTPATGALSTTTLTLPAISGAAQIVQASSPGTTQTGAFHLGGVVSMFSFDDIRSVATDVLTLDNATASDAVNTMQFSPAIRFDAHRWNTSAGGSDKTEQWRIFAAGAGTTTTSATLRFDASVDGGAFSNKFLFDSNGNMTTSGTLTTGNIAPGSASTIQWSSRAILSSPVDGKVNARLAASTLGSGIFDAGAHQISGANGDLMTFTHTEEQLTLSTTGTTTDTTANLLPANAIIDAVVFRITTTITTATTVAIGDATTPTRFSSTGSGTPCGAANLSATATGICFFQADQTGAAGPRQTAAAKIRVTTDVNPGAGVIRLVVYYHTWTAPTS